MFRARKTEAPLPPTAHDLLSRNPYTPTSTLAQSILEHSRLLNELVSVREWLHDCAPPPHLPEATTGYWKFTKHRLLQGLRTGNKRELDPLVTELDPDAPNRSDNGKGLSPDDTVGYILLYDFRANFCLELRESSCSGFIFVCQSGETK